MGFKNILINFNGRNIKKKCTRQKNIKICHKFIVILKHLVVEYIIISILGVKYNWGEFESEYS